MVVCPMCRFGNAEDATFCERCERNLAAEPVTYRRPPETAASIQAEADAIDLKPFRQRKSDAGFILGLCAVALLVIFGWQAFFGNEPAPADAAPRRSARPPAESFTPGTLRQMAHTAAVSIAKNMAAGNTEVVRALFNGPISIPAATGCRMTVVMSPLLDDPEFTKQFANKYRVDVANAARAVKPRARAEATAQIPPGVPPLRVLGPGGEDLEASGIRVALLLHDCGEA